MMDEDEKEKLKKAKKNCDAIEDKLTGGHGLPDWLTVSTVGDRTVVTIETGHDVDVSFRHNDKVMLTKSVEGWLEEALRSKELRNAVSSTYWEHVEVDPEETLDEVLGLD